MAPEPNANGMSAQTLPPRGMPSSTQDGEVWTTNTGAPVVNDQNSLTTGRRGPILLEDYHLIEKLAQFDRERIPERVVHARGFVAKGYFETTADISHLTFASPFAEVGKRTPVAVRLSTVVHERGSPESLRDVRGFSVKFYTETGNWDIVGNNIPVFFIRDGIQFPDLVHSLKPNPRSHLQEGWRILDFLSHHPESCHILTWLLDDHGIPADWRHMEGFGVHTFKFVNAEGEETYVKLHFKPKDGVKFLSDEESKMVGTANKRHSHATEDAFEAIERGDYPEWTFKIQTMEIADEFDYEFDPLDPTKNWDEERFPMIEVGRMVLDQNVDNFFNENEQIAFSPGVLIPGILASDDKLLQTRIFSYSDTQRHRLGPNYLMLPVNAPRNKHHNNHYDGFMNFTHRNEEIDYFPSRNNNIKEAKINAPVWQAETVHGQRTKEMIQKENNFYQAGQRYRSFDPARQERFIGHLLEWLTEPKCTTEVKQIWLQYWAQVDKGLAQRLESGLKEAGAI